MRCQLCGGDTIIMGGRPVKAQCVECGKKFIRLEQGWVPEKTEKSSKLSKLDKSFMAACVMLIVSGTVIMICVDKLLR